MTFGLKFAIEETLSLMILYDWRFGNLSSIGRVISLDHKFQEPNEIRVNIECDKRFSALNC